MGRSEHSEIDNILLINYAYRLLSVEAASRVAYTIQTNEEVKEQYRKVMQLLTENPGIDPELLLKKLEGISENDFSERIPGFTSTQKWLVAAAIILIVSTVSFYYYSSYHSPEHLAMELIQTKPMNPDINATRGDTSVDSTMEWEEMLIKNKYSSVIALLEKENNRSEEQQFFLAIAYLKSPQPQPENAEVLFKKLVQSENKYTSDAWLYLGLSQVLLNQNEQAITSLRHVEQTAQVKELETRLRK